uniref:Uncharacterized protein n=1 Tax=Arundo donax TaxID=35708 RepID=A0A0A8YTC9_ARUDO
MAMLIYQSHFLLFFNIKTGNMAGANLPVIFLLFC